MESTGLEGCKCGGRTVNDCQNKGCLERMFEDLCPGCVWPCFACFDLDGKRKRPNQDYQNPL